MSKRKQVVRLLAPALPHPNLNSRYSQPHSSRSDMASFFGSRSTRSGSPTDLVIFYEGYGKDTRGRSLSDILRWNASKLESSHDYIQTVFPLPEASGVNWDAPIIDRRVFDAFQSRPELRTKLRESFQKILWFYGFKLEKQDSIIKVVKGDTYDKHHENWDSRFDHNHLRITRIIRCLRVLGLEDEALAFRVALEENTKHVSSRSREYWRRAAERALNIRPDLEIDNEEDHSVGPKFLCEFEKERRKKKTEAGRAQVPSQEPTDPSPGGEVQTSAAKSAKSEAKSELQRVEEQSKNFEGEKVVEKDSAPVEKDAEAKPDENTDEASALDKAAEKTS